MKTNPSHPDDGPLDALLHEWNPQPPLPPRFQEQVWRRIGRAEVSQTPRTTLAEQFAAWLASLQPRPAFAAAYLAVLLASGAGAGWSLGRQETARVTAELGARYAYAVDPTHP